MVGGGNMRAITDTVCCQEGAGASNTLFNTIVKTGGHKSFMDLDLFLDLDLDLDLDPPSKKTPKKKS